MTKKIAVIIGAGPAGITAGYELLKKTNIQPIIYEESKYIGGISKTINYKGNRIDIGGHRFFSKSDLVMEWWKNILPIDFKNNNDKTMLIRNRISRIYFLGNFFDYPISLKWKTFYHLGPIRILKITLSYLFNLLFPIKEEKSLEDFFINRFGKELYLTFFKDYTEKVWGVSCKLIKPEWGAQRIKGLSITKTLLHSIKRIFHENSSIEQKTVETSLIEQFLYPKYGPGQLWEEVSEKIKKMKGEIFLNHKVIKIETDNIKIKKIFVKDLISNEIKEIEPDFVFSTMPVKDLIASMIPLPPKNVRNIAKNLIYRDFITVGLLLKKSKNDNNKIASIPDNWIYIQEKNVKVGRIQIFNNWSPYLVKNPDTLWIGLEYFVNEGDNLWNKEDSEFAKFAISELKKINFINNEDDIIDYTIIKTPKAYPAYFGSYDKFNIIRDFTDNIENLFLIGRNGMHRYNNQDHSMLTAITAVNNIIHGKKNKNNIWNINIEKEYHETDSKKI